MRQAQTGSRIPADEVEEIVEITIRRLDRGETATHSNSSGN